MRRLAPRGLPSGLHWAAVAAPRRLDGEAFLYFGWWRASVQHAHAVKQTALRAVRALIFGDLERVFEVGPVFRAENSYTHR